MQSGIWMFSTVPEILSGAQHQHRNAPRCWLFDVPANYDLQNNTFAVNLSFNPWILVNNCPGNLSDDGEVVGYSGIVLKWTGSQLQGRYISKISAAGARHFRGEGYESPSLSLSVFDTGGTRGY
jgi:hypothetical protein